ncbi:MAG: MATE family efflux transporter [Oscillospiraceae bacterium]|nr:MATE family efflux transporter [Oscillospiraceae bacterium]
MNKKTEFLGNAPIPKALLAMGIPTMVGMLINSLYNLVDAYFVGNLGESQMGAISVVFPLGQLIVGLGLLFGNGAGSYISRLLGRGEKDTANKAASTALYSSLTTGAIFIIISVVFLKQFLMLLGASKSILPYALEYSRIYVISCIFNVFNVTVNSIITSEGAAKTAMSALLTGAILNTILDPIFIYTFSLGVSGAAIATAISQIASACVYIMYIVSGKSNFSFKISDYIFDSDIYAEIFKIGVPVFVFQLLTSVSISLTNRAIKDYGDSAIAGIGAVTRLVSMGSLTIFGFIKGFQPIAGFSFGAKKFDRLHEAIKASVQWSTIFCVIVGLIFVMFPTQIISQFTQNDLSMIEIGTKALRANGVSFMFFGFHTVYSSLFLALGKGREGFILGACRQGICFVPVIFILPIFWGINGILYAQPIADLITVIVTVVMAVTLNRKLKRLRENNTV